ncbi:hypothetical protein MY1884_003007 [Beauveria asiatica]
MAINAPAAPAIPATKPTALMGIIALLAAAPVVDEVLGMSAALCVDGRIACDDVSTCCEAVAVMRVAQLGAGCWSYVGLELGNEVDLAEPGDEGIDTSFPGERSRVGEWFPESGHVRVGEGVRALEVDGLLTLVDSSRR